MDGTLARRRRRSCNRPHYGINSTNVAVGVEELTDDTNDWALRLDRACSSTDIATDGKPVLDVPRYFHCFREVVKPQTAAWWPRCWFPTHRCDTVTSHGPNG